MSPSSFGLRRHCLRGRNEQFKRNSEHSYWFHACHCAKLRVWCLQTTLELCYLRDFTVKNSLDKPLHTHIELLWLTLCLYKNERGNVLYVSRVQGPPFDVFMTEERTTQETHFGSQKSTLGHFLMFSLTSIFSFINRYQQAFKAIKYF